LGKRKRSPVQEDGRATRARSTSHLSPSSSIEGTGDPNQERISRLSSPDDVGVVSPQQLELRGASSTAQAYLAASIDDEDVTPSQWTFRTKSLEGGRISREPSQRVQQGSLEFPSAAANTYTASSYTGTVNISQQGGGDRHGLSQVLDQDGPLFPIASVYSPTTASHSQARLTSLQERRRAGMKDLADCASLDVLESYLGSVLFDGINASELRKNEPFTQMTQAVLLQLPAGDNDWIMSITIGFDQATSAQRMVNMGHAEELENLLGADLYRGYKDSRLYRDHHDAIKVLVSNRADSPQNEDERRDHELVLALSDSEGQEAFDKLYPKFS
jgi:hypothetical protein